MRTLAAPTLLALETATPTLGVALYQAGRLRAECIERGVRAPSSLLLPAIQRLLESCGCTLDAVDGIALSIGPGSFTGLRVALASAKGLAFGGQPPVLAVSTLAGLAACAHPAPGPLAALLDARRGEIYAGVFAHAGAHDATLVPESLYTPAELAAKLPSATGLVAGEGADDAARQLCALRPDLRRLAPPLFEARAVAIARLAWPRFRAGDGGDAGLLVPRYLRRAEAEALQRGSPVEPQPDEAPAFDATRPRR